MQFLKFAFVGAIGTVLHYVVLILLVSVLHSDPAIGALAGATCGAASNYFLNHRFTFPSDRPHIQAVPRFFFMAGIGIFLNGLIVKIFTLAGAHYLTSQLTATMTVFVINFYLSNIWIFRKTR